jgi:carbonic anhydrase
LEVVRLSLANLATFPWIAEAVSAGQLTLQGFRFDIRSGVLTTLVNDRFVPVS